MDIIIISYFRYKATISLIWYKNNLSPKRDMYSIRDQQKPAFAGPMIILKTTFHDTLVAPKDYQESTLQDHLNNLLMSQTLA